MPNQLHHAIACHLQLRKNLKERRIVSDMGTGQAFPDYSNYFKGHTKDEYSLFCSHQGTLITSGFNYMHKAREKDYRGSGV
jgi:hypothetical protein